MAKDPALFVLIVTHVFRAKHEADEERKQLSSQETARATNSFRLLESFANVPGRDGETIDAAALFSWVAAVRKLAAYADRLEIAEPCIGKMLSHAPADSEDRL